MTRSELEHLIRASGAIANDPELIIIGSQAILGQYPDAPAVLLASMEADIYPRNHPERAILIDGAIGEGSYFHEQFGYFAQGVGPETAVLPEGWELRLIRVGNEQTGGSTGWCLEANDLAISKYAAGREKDRKYTAELARSGLTTRETLHERLAATTVDGDLFRMLASRIDRDFGPREPSRP